MPATMLPTPSEYTVIGLRPKGNPTADRTASALHTASATARASCTSATAIVRWSCRIGKLLDAGSQQ